MSRNHPKPVPVDLALAHVRQLQKLGIPLIEIKRQTGVSRVTLQRILYGRCQWVTKGTYDALRAVTPHQALPGALVDATGTRRRLQALHYDGWSWTELDRQRTQHPRSERLGDVVLHQDKLTQRVADEVAELFDRLVGVEPPTGKGATQARNRARKCGWAPAFAWNNIDDVTERAKGVRAA